MASSAQTCPHAASLDDIHPLDKDLLQDPFPYFARLREEAPVHRHPETGIVTVSTYEHVLEVNKRPKIFSSDMAKVLKSGGAGKIHPDEQAIMDQGLPWVPTMLTADPPAHSRYKKLAMKAFTPVRVEQLSDYISEVAHRLIDTFAADGRVEFKSAFANKFPATIIADLLGIPNTELAQFQIWLKAALDRLSGAADLETRLDAARKMIELQRYFVDKIADRRANPRDDLISDLVHATLAEEGDPRPLNDAELYGILEQMFVAGQETTAHAVTYGLYQLIRHPEQMAAVKADPSLIPNLAEETLRYLSPSNAIWRIVKEDTELGGVPLKAGDVVLLRYGAANRDAEKFADPERFDVTRDNARQHLAFGAGIHTCMGSNLARKELAIAFPTLLKRLPNMRLADGNSFRYSPSPLLRGVMELHLVFDPA